VLLEGIVGQGVELDTAILEAVRPSSISFHLAKHLLYTRFRDPGQEPPLYLFGQIKRITRQWIEEGYRGGDAQIKAETMRTLWVPGVNNLGTFGRWAFEEFTDVFEIEAAFARLIHNMTAKKIEA
jgi:hypothetical protein